MLDPSTLQPSLYRVLSQQLDPLDARSKDEIDALISDLNQRKAFALYMEHLKLGDYVDTILLVMHNIQQASKVAQHPEILNGTPTKP